MRINTIRRNYHSACSSDDGNVWKRAFFFCSPEPSRSPRSMLSLGWSRWLRLPVAVAMLVPEPAPGLLGAISLATADAQSWPFITITAFPTMDINEGMEANCDFTRALGAHILLYATEEEKLKPAFDKLMTCCAATPATSLCIRGPKPGRREKAEAKAAKAKEVEAKAKEAEAKAKKEACKKVIETRALYCSKATKSHEKAEEYRHTYADYNDNNPDETSEFELRMRQDEVDNFLEKRMTLTNNA